MSEGSSERFQLGEFWLSQRDNSPVWCVTWFDQKSRQTKRLSTRERDFEKAKLALAAHFIENAKPSEEKPEDVPIAFVLDQYWMLHGKKAGSAETIKAAIAKWKAFWGSDPLSALTIERQKDFRVWFDSQTYTRGKDPTPRAISPGTVARQWNVGPTAFEWALRAHKIKHYPHVPYLSNSRRRTRILSLEEAAALFNAAAEDEHMWRWLLLAFGTAARPSAPLEIVPEMISLAGNYINLLPPGREQDPKKRRPTLPICSTLRPWLEAWLRPESLIYRGKGNEPRPVSTLISWRGKPIDKIKEGFGRIKELAGLADPKIVPYTVRHTMITHLMRSRVPEWDREVWIGHKSPGNQTTAGYVHLDPDYLKPAADATDAFFDQLAPYVKRPLRASCVLAYSQNIPGNGDKALFSAVSYGARDRDRTCDPYHVKEGEHQ